VLLFFRVLSFVCAGGGEPGSHVAVVDLLCEVEVYSLYFGGYHCCAGAESDVEELWGLCVRLDDACWALRESLTLYRSVSGGM